MSKFFVAGVLLLSLGGASVISASPLGFIHDYYQRKLEPFLGDCWLFEDDQAGVLKGENKALAIHSGVALGVVSAGVSACGMALKGGAFFKKHVVKALVGSALLGISGGLFLHKKLTQWFLQPELERWQLLREREQLREEHYQQVQNDIFNRLTEWSLHPEHKSGVALALAIRMGNIDLVRTMLDNGADIDANGSIALQTAILYENLPILRLLVERGVNLNVEIGGLTPVQYARRFVTYTETYLDFIRTLGGEVTNDDRIYVSPYYHGSCGDCDSCLAGCVDLGRTYDAFWAYCEHGASVYRQEGVFLTIAIAGGQMDLLRTIARPAGSEPVNPFMGDHVLDIGMNGSIALQTAILFGNVQSLEYLIDVMKVDLNGRIEGMTPLEYAERYAPNPEEITRILREHQA